MLKLPRRNFLRLAAGAAALPAVSRIAKAQAYPTRPVRIIVPLPAGGATDILANLMGQRLSERLGQPFSIEHRPGVGSTIGTEAVVNAPPDGHTLLLVGPSNATSPSLYDKLNFNFVRDIAPVAGIIRFPNVMLVNPAIPTTTVAEFIAYAKVNADKIKMASGGIGTSVHVAGELFKMMTGVNMEHVAYRGAQPTLAAVIGGQAQVVFLGTAPSMEPIRTGKLRALAVTGAARSEALPDLPTVGDFVPGYEASAVYGLGAPQSTPAEIIDKLNNEINAGLADPKLKARLENLGGTVIAGSPVEFGKLIADETEKWAKVIKFAGIKPQ